MQPWLTWRGFLFGNLTHRSTAHMKKKSDILQVADGHMVISATVSSSVRTWHSQEARIETILFQSQLAGKWKMLRFLWICRDEAVGAFMWQARSCCSTGLGIWQGLVLKMFLQISCTSIPAKRKWVVLGITPCKLRKAKKKMVCKRYVFSSRKLHAIFGSHCGTTQGTGQSVGFWCPKMQRVRIGHWWWCFTGGWYQSYVKTDDVGARNFLWATHFGESSTTQIYTIWRLHTLWIFAFTNWDLNFE